MTRVVFVRKEIAQYRRVEAISFQMMADREHRAPNKLEQISSNKKSYLRKAAAI